MGKIKEPVVAYKPKRALSHKRTRPSLPVYTAGELRSLPARERDQILASQAKHAATMFAAGIEEVISDSSPVIEY